MSLTGNKTNVSLNYLTCPVLRNQQLPPCYKAQWHNGAGVSCCYLFRCMWLHQSRGIVKAASISASVQIVTVLDQHWVQNVLNGPWNAPVEWRNIRYFEFNTDDRKCTEQHCVKLQTTFCKPLVTCRALPCTSSVTTDTVARSFVCRRLEFTGRISLQFKFSDFIQVSRSADLKLLSLASSYNVSRHMTGLVLQCWQFLCRYCPAFLEKKENSPTFSFVFFTSPE